MAVSERKKARIRKKVRASIKARTKGRKKSGSSYTPTGSGQVGRAAKKIRSRKHRIADAVRRSGG